jgi:FAD binding domain
MTGLPAGAIQELSRKIRGEIVQPGDAGYDAARAVWNGYVDGRPALLVRPSDNQDVSTAIGFARENGLLIAIRGGGHNSAGTGVCDEGLVIDLSSLRGVSVDPATGRVRAQGGEFTFRSAPIGTHVYSGLIVKRFEDARRYIAFHRDFVRGLPDEATVWMVVRSRGASTSISSAAARARRAYRMRTRRPSGSGWWK